MMAVSGYLGWLILFLGINIIFIFGRLVYQLLIHGDGSHGNGLPVNWPLVGMSPTFVVNLNKFNDKLTEFLQRSNGTFLYKGLWFSNGDYMMTSHPENVRHIMSKDNSTYVKGSEWMKTFDIFGESLFNADGESWRQKRKTLHAFLNHKQFQRLVTRLIPDCVEQGLVKVLDHVSQQGLVVDLHDLLVRHSSDIACAVVAGHQYYPRLLSIEFPKNKLHDAFNDALVAAFYRSILPQTVWKLQSWLQVGNEKRRSKAWEALDDLASEYISTQREKCFKQMESSNQEEEEEEEEDFNFVRCFLTGHEVTGHEATTATASESRIRDGLLGLMLAMVDTKSTTLTWFFYLLSKNPSVETKIREEIKTNYPSFNLNIEWTLNKLVYLHAALCETLRLFPPVPFNIRTSTQHDILPSGHRVDQGMKVLISLYAMGRMTWIWGEDCDEFKPERWINEQGRIKVEPPTKFASFFGGPRICIGKDLAFTIMKATAVAIIHNYDVHVLPGQDQYGNLKDSVLLQLKHGLKVTVKHRSCP